MYKNEKKRILVTGCGGSPTNSFVRSLRDADVNNDKYYIVGVDCDKYTIHRNECDKSYLCPKASDKKYLEFIKQIIKKEKIDFMHTQPEIEVYTIGKNREEILNVGCKLLMPSQKTVEILRDKLKSYNVWKKEGIKVPKNVEINNESDLKKAFETFKNDIWIRETIGAAGKGSLSRPSFEFALSYIKSRKSFGKVVAAEHLLEKTVTWQSVWYEGKMVVAQGRERLSWEMANRTQSGVTGLTGTGKIVCDSDLDNLAIKCILAIDKKPNGIFSVDFTYDSNNVPNPTEINIGKFFTTHYFITKTGCNMPKILVDLAFGEYDGKYDIKNPCKKGSYWIRGMDVKPVLIDEKQIIEKEEEYKKRLNEIK